MRLILFVFLIGAVYGLGSAGFCAQNGTFMTHETATKTALSYELFTRSGIRDYSDLEELRQKWALDPDCCRVVEHRAVGLGRGVETVARLPLSRTYWIQIDYAEKKIEIYVAIDSCGMVLDHMSIVR